MPTQRIEWTKVKVRPRRRRPDAPIQGIALEDLVRQLGVARAMNLIPELREL